MNKWGYGANKCPPLCAITWCKSGRVSHAPLGLLLYSKHHRCLPNQHWRTVREQMKSTESSPFLLRGIRGGWRVCTDKRRQWERQLPTKQPWHVCLPQGDALKVPSPPCRERRQVEERVIKRERKVERQERQMGGEAWGGGRGERAELALKSRSSKRSGWQLI